MTAPEPLEHAALPPSPPALRLGAALGFVVLAAVLAQGAGALTVQLARTALVGLGAPADSGLLLVPAMVASSSALIAVALVAPALAGVPLRSALGVRGAPPSTFFAAALGTVMLGPTADRTMSAMELLLPDLTIGIVPRLNELVAVLPLWAAIPAFALLPGVSEELVFRGLLQRAAPPGARGIALSAVCFALFHVDPHHTAGVLPLGLFLAWVGSRAGTLVTIVAHVVNNAAAIGAAHTAELAVGYGQAEAMPWWWLPPSLLLVAASAVVIVRTTPPPPAPRTR